MNEEVMVECAGGTVIVPRMPLLDRMDGGHLVVNPPRSVWERSELTPLELADWGCLTAATGRAMLDCLPQLSGGCVNYWEAGNWSLADAAHPPGPKTPQQHRRVHLHIFGRSREARHPDWLWGESPRFPSFANAKTWAASFESLSTSECDALRERIHALLQSLSAFPASSACGRELLSAARKSKVTAL